MSKYIIPKINFSDILVKSLNIFYEKQSHCMLAVFLFIIFLYSFIQKEGLEGRKE